MSKITGSRLRHISMDLGKGIVIGAVNRLQLNKGCSYCADIRGEWQLITIFGKDK
jgi:hypothetical protein